MTEHCDPPETNEPERCRDCREQLDCIEVKEGLCRQCVMLRAEDDLA